MNKIDKKGVIFTGPDTVRKITSQERFYRELRQHSGIKYPENHKGVKLIETLIRAKIISQHGDKGSEFTSLVNFDDPFRMNQKSDKKEPLEDPLENKEEAPEDLAADDPDLRDQGEGPEGVDKDEAF